MTPVKSRCSKYGDRPTTESFIAVAKEIHNGWYSYEKAVYTGSREKLIVTCPEHGDFSVQASAHTNNRNGCFLCMCDQLSRDRASNGEVFIEKAKAVHGEKYDYSKVAYKQSHAKVAIGCREHGFFFTQPTNHLSGTGCPKCAKFGYSTTKPGLLYVLKHENLTKVGITNRTPTRRIREINRSSGFDFHCVFKQKFEDGTRPPALELALLNELATSHNQPTEIFDGSTECFYDVDLETLLSRITLLATPILPH